jgi:hypothetical protein
LGLETNYFLENDLLKEIHKLLKWVPDGGTISRVQIYKGTHKTLTKKKFQEDEENTIK